MNTQAFNFVYNAVRAGLFAVAVLGIVSLIYAAVTGQVDLSTAF